MVMEKKGTLDTRDSTNVATKAGTRTVKIVTPDAFWLAPTLPGQPARDDNAVLAAAIGMVEQRFHAAVGSGGWRIAWKNAPKKSGDVIVLIDGAPPSTEEEKTLAGMVASIVRAVQGEGAYLTP